MNMHLHCLILFVALVGLMSCGQHQQLPPIDKVETEYRGECVLKDSCITSVITYYSDGSREETHYVLYPTVKYVTLYDSSGMFIQEIKVLNKDSTLSKMYYDEFGNYLRYERTFLSKFPHRFLPGSNTYYVNTYDRSNRLVSRTERNSKGESTFRSDFLYDTLGYSMIEMKGEEGYDEYSFIYYYQNDKLVLENNLLSNMKYEFQYNEHGQPVFEDVRSNSHRKSYYYSNGLLTKTEDRLRPRIESSFPDSFFQRVIESTEYLYIFDESGRPVETHKSTFDEGKFLSKTVIITDYH